MTTCNNLQPGSLAQPEQAVGRAVRNPCADGGLPPGLLGAPATALAYLELPALAASVPLARRHVRGTLAQWGLGAVADDAETVTSELVTNAIVASAALAFRAEVGLLVATCPGQLMVLVWDASSDRPVRRHDDDDAVAGRGLGIVAALSARCGWTPDGRGKVVWAVLDLARP